ncbi:UDP-N-acetylmuramate--L-alanine ligase [Clostridium sp. YIM B02515]|uniref:UDP-N-acetylmuramate--L-alanine ligase n=1 Tax=Clostridium rhizosphaerae TaxID=2803861 RepID=A0ABS1TGK2_9CLOT|nr:UDP-N-acetylmuramate--L-alanine ligase [Clostridium rhizosphaerae]MBL4938490.1 UDP-N-acetylmuramate--L-alanine ligase [Clostridium rhizosphaerae]
MDKRLHVHFMGIRGSGMAPIAVIAQKSGFEVSGCDCNETSYYSDALLDSGIDIKLGHSSEHLKGVDILAVTPAVFDINPNHPEIVEARKRNILMTWQEFMGKYLQKDKFLVAIAGTHGKSTTTVLTGLVLEAGELDPIVEAGTIYKPWGGGFRISESKYFVCEADEFNCNFLNYSPSLIIINNIEMDHPEFFKDFAEFKRAFKKFIRNIKNSGTLVVNEENEGIREVLIDIKDWLQEKNVKVIGYYLKHKFNFPFSAEYKGEIMKFAEDGVDFEVCGPNFKDSFKIGLLGAHNVLNSLGVLSAAIELGVSIETMKTVFKKFSGIGRRTELVDEVNKIKVYDDYGHHPTAIAAVLDTFKTIYQNKKVYAIVEPHQISRLKLFPEEFIAALNNADEVIVTKTYIGREINKNLEPVDMGSFISKVDAGKASYIEDFNNVADTISLKAKEGDIIIVFGAGNSHKLAKLIVERLKNTESK